MPVSKESLPCSGKVWQGESLANWLFSSLWQKKVWWMNRSANRLLIVSTNLDGSSLANHGWFTKFAKLSPRQTSPLYGIHMTISWCYCVFIIIVIDLQKLLTLHMRAWLLDDKTSWTWTCLLQATLLVSTKFYHQVVC